MKQIDVLPDDALLLVFDFYMIINPSYNGKTETEAWQSLVHVCRRWRTLVFESPRRLNLRLFCTPKTPARDTLDVWPALPLLINGSMASTGPDNVIAALGRSNRVRQVILYLAGWQLEQVLAPMQEPFPELTDLRLFADDETPPIIPDSFLDGSASRLQSFLLSGIPFPGAPKLLLSANHLSYLELINVPHSGYISPEAALTLLCASTSLDTFTLEFQSHLSYTEWENPIPPPPKRFILPALDQFRFKGVVEYLEDFVSFLDAPQLNLLFVTFFNQIDFDCPRLAQFINRTISFGALDEAHVEFNDEFASIKLCYQTSMSGFYDLLINISCREPDWQLSSIEQVCNFSFQPLSTVEDLYIDHEYSQLVWKNDAIENTLWLQLLLPFVVVKNIYVSKEFAPGIAVALIELVGAGLTVLPSLQNIFVEGLEPSGPLRENLGLFVTARQLSRRPVVICDWDKDSDKG